MLHGRQMVGVTASANECDTLENPLLLLLLPKMPKIPNSL